MNKSDATFQELARGTSIPTGNKNQNFVSRGAQTSKYVKISRPVFLTITVLSLGKLIGSSDKL